MLDIIQRVAYPVVSKYLHYYHRMCFWIIAGLTARDHLYAHTRQATGKNAGTTGLFVGSPTCIGGGGSTHAPYGRVTSNTNRNTPPFAVELLSPEAAKAIYSLSGVTSQIPDNRVKYENIPKLG